MPSTPYNRAGPGQPIKNALMPQPAAYDEWGNPYDADGNSLARPNMSLGEIALTVLAAPVTVGVGIAGALSPYGVEEGWRVPPAIAEPYEAGKRFLSPGGGFENMPDQQSTQDATTLLFSMYGGNALNPLARRPAGSVGMFAGQKAATADHEMLNLAMGRALSDTGRPNPLGSAIASGAEQGKPIRAYHGTRFASEPLHTYPVTDRMASAGDTKVRLWASSDADVASSYAEPIGNDLYWDEIYPRQTGHTPPPRAGGVFPVEMNFTNPLEVDAAGAGFQSVPWGGLIYPVDELAYVAQNMGHDGLIVKSLQDHMYDQNHAPSTVYAALKRGTVRSPLTGETLFSDTGRPNAVGAALASSNENAVRSFHGTRYNVKGQFIPSDDGLLGPGVYSSVDPQKAGAHSGYNRGSIENPVMNYEHGKIFPFDVAQPVATEADWMRVLSDMEGAAPRVDQDRSVAVRAQQALANEGFGSVRYGDTVNTFAKGNITSPLTGETLFSDTRPSLLGSALASEQGKGITAYHGSPHSFDKFDMSKIGSGEGAQAFGHGLYFAENEGVAHTYRTGLGPQDADGALADKLLRESGGDKQKAMRAVTESVPMTDLDQSTRVMKMLSYIDHGPSGHMYQVRIDANPEDFLDWDKPLGKQGNTGRKAASVLGPMPEGFDDPLTVRGHWLPSDMQSRSVELFGGRDGLTGALREAGIPGIKYLDQMSRNAGDGSRNYVVFDDNLIEIMKKYGLAGALYGGTNSLYQEGGE